MEEIQVARTFLEEKFKIYTPTQSRLEKMVRIVRLNNGNGTMDTLFFEAKELLGKLGYCTPLDDRIINMMYEIAIGSAATDPPTISLKLYMCELVKLMKRKLKFF